jgi:hypothetical protein
MHESGQKLFWAPDLVIMTYSKGRSWSFFVKLSIHPSVPSSIHVWHLTRKKTLAEINNPPPTLLRMCRCLGKACPAPGGGTPKSQVPCCGLQWKGKCGQKSEVESCKYNIVFIVGTELDIFQSICKNCSLPKSNQIKTKPNREKTQIRGVGCISFFFCTYFGDKQKWRCKLYK